MHLDGIVQDGAGQASVWISKFMDAYVSWTGVAIYPGSLNILVNSKFDWNDMLYLKHRKCYSLRPYGGEREIFLIPCTISSVAIKNVDGYLWSTTNAAKEVSYKTLEVISQARLRDALEVHNGSLVRVDIPTM